MLNHNRLTAALQDSGNPLATFRKILAEASPVVGPKPAKKICPPRSAPGAKANPRRSKFIAFRQDWDPNLDNCGFSEMHDANNSRQRRDLEGIDLGWAIARESRDGVRSEDAAHANRRQPSAAKILDWLRDSRPVEPRTAVDTLAEVRAPTPSKRALMRRTSQKQRVMLKAVRLSQQGIAWDAIGQVLRISRAEARRLRQRVVNLIGNEAIRRDVGCAIQKRDHRKLVPRIVCGRTSIYMPAGPYS